MVDSSQKRVPRYDKPTMGATALLRAMDVLIFVVIFLCSAVVIASLAVAAPIVLFVTALLRLVANRKNENGWRAAGA
jgi:hypothetical protein